MTIPKAIAPVGQYETWIHAMIIAAPGFGKTVFAGTAEDALFLTTDPEGTVSALAFGSRAQEWQIKSWTTLNEAYRYLRDGGIKEMGLKWVIIDNTSEAQNLGMMETMAAARKRNAARDEFVPGIDDHQRSQLMMKDMVKRFHDLPVNILWTAWRKTEEDSEGESYFTCGIHGQQGLLAQTIQGYMNVVGFGEVVDVDGKDVRRIFFSQHKPYMGKDRYVALGEARDNLTVPKMEALIEAAKAKHLQNRKATSAKSAGVRPKRTPVAGAKAAPAAKKPLGATRAISPRKK